MDGSPVFAVRATGPDGRAVRVTMDAEPGRGVWLRIDGHPAALIPLCQGIGPLRVGLRTLAAVATPD